MSRREIVVLVSRAIAILTIIAALNDLLINVRFWVLLLSQQMRLQSMNLPMHIGAGIAWTEVIFSLARILVLCVIAGWFWMCGPTIERIFLPTGTQERPDTPQ